MSPKDSHRANDGALSNRTPRGGADSGQARATTPPRGYSPDRASSDETSTGTDSNALSSRRLNPQQPKISTSPRRRSAAAPNVPEQEGQSRPVDHSFSALLLWDPVLQTLAAGLNDIEATRVAQSNRYRILTTTAEDSDGEVRGFGLPVDHPAVAALDAQLKTLEFLDAQMTKALSKQLRMHALHPWVKRQKGIGEKTVARLLGTIKDPYWNDLHDRPRTVGELFAFCGVAGPGQRRQRGQTSNWNADARKRVWIMTGPIIRGNGPYRAVYDAARERYAEKTHTAACAQCGKKGAPAAVGSEWRDGHKHAGAIRLVMREILRDLWTEARAIYEAREPLAEQATA